MRTSSEAGISLTVGTTTSGAHNPARLLSPELVLAQVRPQSRKVVESRANEKSGGTRPSTPRPGHKMYFRGRFDEITA